jgi:hypothetical protein
MKAPNPTITGVRANREGQSMRFEPAIQDRRLYYRLLVNDRAAGSLTDEAHALLTIEHWRNQGWIPVVRCSECRLVIPHPDGGSICADCLDAAPRMSINTHNL